MPATPAGARPALAARTRSLLTEAADSTGAERRHRHDQVVVLNLPVAEAIAGRYRGRGEPLDDLVQAATVGLLQAVRRFDPYRGHDFLSYAVPLMSGEVRRHFRDHAWVVRPPRRVQELRQRIARVRPALIQSQGRMPSSDDLATALDVGVGEVAEALAAGGCYHPASLDVRTAEGGGGAVGDLLPGEDRAMAQAQAGLVVRPMLARLDERDRRIVVLRFYREWSQDRIAADVGLSQMQVSRRLGRILDDLRHGLA